MALGCMAAFQGALLFGGSIMNPMINTKYELSPEISSLFFTTATVAFIITAPITFKLREKQILTRRQVMYLGLFLISLSSLTRPGDLIGDPFVHIVYVSQFVNGVGLAMLTTQTFPEIVAAAENTPVAQTYEKEKMNLYISGLFVSL